VRGFGILDTLPRVSVGALAATVAAAESATAALSGAAVGVEAADRPKDVSLFRMCAEDIAAVRASFARRGGVLETHDLADVLRTLLASQVPQVA